MADKVFKRRMAEILSADVEGYSRLMGVDEEATIHTLTACRSGNLNFLNTSNRIWNNNPWYLL